MDKQTIQRADQATGIDAGLRQHMMKVYNYMTAALLVTALASYIAVVTELYMYFFNSKGLSIVGWLVLLSPLAMVFFINSALAKASIEKVKVMFFAFAVLMGLSIAPTLMIYTQASMVKVFLITAATFGSMSIYGYTTKRSLTNIGSFLIMGLFGIIIASLVNIFFASDAMSFVISIIAVLIFTGLAAYDTQKIKLAYAESDSQDLADRKVIVGALSIYLDFINLFLHLLRIFGDRR